MLFINITWMKLLGLKEFKVVKKNHELPKRKMENSGQNRQDLTLDHCQLLFECFLLNLLPDLNSEEHFNQ